MKIFKKIMSLALVCVMALTVLTACGTSNEDALTKAINEELKYSGISISYSADLTTKAKNVTKYAQEALDGGKSFSDLIGTSSIISSGSGSTLSSFANVSEDICTQAKIDTKSEAAAYINVSYVPASSISQTMAWIIGMGKDMGKTVKSIGYTTATLTKDGTSQKVMVIVLSYESTTK